MGFRDQSCQLWAQLGLGGGTVPKLLSSGPASLGHHSWGQQRCWGVGGAAQCRVGHQVLCHLCLKQLCLALAAQPPPQLPDPSLWFSNPRVPVLPLGLAAAPPSAPKIPCVSQPDLSANTSCSQKSSGEGDSALPSQRAFCVQSWLRYLKNSMVVEHWLYYLFHFIFLAISLGWLIN